MVFSESLVTNKSYSQEEGPYDNSSFKKKFYIPLDRILYDENTIKRISKWRKAVFISDISSVLPSFEIIDQLTNKEGIPYPTNDFIRWGNE